ncbi:MAG: hypothetical protein HFI73_01255 [Bacilli bacterium]|jgi:hypothetical protein|nr:hypothetical protein [Bacilli bacterium]
MKCPNCGFEGLFNGGICPNCSAVVSLPTNQNGENISNANVQEESVYTSSVNNNNLVAEGINENASAPVSSPQVMIDNNSLQQENNINSNVSVEVAPVLTSEVEKQKKDMSKIYYIILGIAVVVFLVLMSVIMGKHFKKNTPIKTTPATTNVTIPKETFMTKNKGVYSNLMSPVNIGNITFGGLLDQTNNKVTDVDVEIIRNLEETEINELVATTSQNLYPGFKWAGVEYRVTLNDLEYLGEGTINPVMKTYLFDTYYKNNFFLVNENYYTIDAISSNVNKIKNGEFALVKVAYQVPVDQNYYICFGENFSSLGCFINS